MSNRVRVNSHGPIQRTDVQRERDLYREVSKTTVLSSAWRTVRTNGLASALRRTREDIILFDRDAHRHIPQIQRMLRTGRFVFDQQRGVLQSRPGKKPRPIVIGSIRNRIVQRSILDVLQGTEEIGQILSTPTSFGGIEGRGREDALEAAYHAIEAGSTVYLRSDIRDFFTAIPREKVHSFLASFIADPIFLDLLRKATETELVNMAQLRNEVEYFPIHEVGVAQGCALSPLLGNILLRDFDRLLNGRGIVCLRYIDDFLLLGRNRRSVLKAFDHGCVLLGQLGLKVYDPRDSNEKAFLGNVQDGFDFLGCNVRPGMIQPSGESCAKFRRRIQEIVDDGRHALRAIAAGGRAARGGFVQVLFDLHNVIRGWGHSYSFCNSRDVMAGLEQFVDRNIDTLLACYDRHQRVSSAAIRRRLLGVQLLQDVPIAPIVGPKRAPQA